MATTTVPMEKKKIRKLSPNCQKRRIQIRTAFLSDVNSFTRGKIHVETEGRHRSLTAMEGDPVIIINPSLAGSWFTTPKPIFPDTVGYWSRHTKFPGSSDTTHVPYDFRNLTPIKFTFHIEDDDLKTFLSPARWTDKGGYICLSSEVF